MVGMVRTCRLTTTIAGGLIAAFFSSSLLFAEVRLPNLFSDHAVLQREQPVRVFGFAKPGEKVSIHFHNQSVAAVTNKYGWWETQLQPEKAGGPYTLTVSGDATAKPLERTDILIGDVWFASGQSNMEMPLRGFNAKLPIKDSEKEIAAANHPQIRLLKQKRTVSSFAVSDASSSWALCTPETAAPFSAAAYFFGREISEREHVAIGLIDSTWGGMPTQAFTSLGGLAKGKMLASFENSEADAVTQANSELLREQLAFEKAKASPDAEVKPAAPVLNWWTPGALYNGMIAPFTHYTIKGVIWYQGEAERGGGRTAYYRQGFPNMIEDWRTQWKQGAFPFILVQLPSFDIDNDHWPTIRDVQRRTLSLENTAMAVTLDTGEAKNIHPPDKQTVGARLALAARQSVYGEKIEGTSPMLVSATPQGATMRVTLSHADGLTMRTAEGGTVGGGFELAGADGVFHPAVAKVDGTAVVVSSPDVADPKNVRYGWTGWVTSFYVNNAGLPMGTFTSEP